jgi:hypothetical protein
MTGATFALGLIGAGASGALAQSTPPPAPTPAPSASAMMAPKGGIPTVAPSGAPTATPAPTPTPSPTPFKLLSLQGSGDAGYESIAGANSARFISGGPSRVFDVSTGPFFDANGGRQLAGPNDFDNALDLQNANVALNINGSQFSGKIEGSFGSDADVIASNGQSRSGVNLTQAYLQAVEGPATVLIGKIETLAGAEYIEAPLNTNYSRSYLFGYAIPFTHTGARVTYAINSKFSVVAGVNNGWDDWKFAGKKKTLEGALLMNLSPGVTWNIQTYNGNDFAVGGNSALFFAPVYTNRMLYDSELTLHATSALTFIANYDNGTQLADSGAFFPVTAHWNGIAGYANYAFTPVYGISLRKETFLDAEGFRTGVPGGVRLQSNTATFNYTPGNNFIFRLEYRLDAADKNAFAFNGVNGPGLFDGRSHQSSLGVEAVVKFP